MPHNRFYFDVPFEEESIVTLGGDEWHHLARVHKSREGDLVELINGKGQLAEAKVLKLKNKQADLCILNIAQEKPPSPRVILAQAIPRMNHLEWIIEKGTELNASAFWLFPGVWSEKETLSENQRGRLKSLTIAAMKQCARLDLPEVILTPPLAQWKLPLEGTLLFGDTESSAPYLWDLLELKAVTFPIIIFIGPEKGFSPQERQFLVEVLKAKGIRLHPNILRAETAPLAALALLQPFVIKSHAK